MRRGRVWLAALVLMPGLAVAEPPMATDDAGTLGRAGSKLELAWAKDGSARGWRLAGGFAPIERLELELSLGRASDTSTSPSIALRTTGFAAKWVPLEMGATTAGLKLEFERERADGGGRTRGTRWLGLLSHRIEPGHALHANLGRSWSRDIAGLRENLTVWSLGGEFGLSDRVSLTGDVFGASGGAGTGRQLGLRVKVVEGFKLSVAAGRQSGESSGRLVAAWEF